MTGTSGFISRHLMATAWARDDSTPEVTFSYTGPTGNPLSDNTVAQALAFNKDGSSIN